MPRVPELLRIDPTEATFHLLRDDCASFHTTNVRGEACLWATRAWWEELNDSERYRAACAYADAYRPAWDALGKTANGRSSR